MSPKELLTMMRGFMPQGVYNKEAMTDEVIDLYLLPWSTEQGKKALFRNFRRLNPEYTQAIVGELKHLASETLIMWGKKDVFQKPAYAGKLQETIPNAKLIWIKDASHWLLEEKPEEVSRHLITFLDGK
jgi:2-hydroxymuconate-semialdehyde hydrolase